jgi:hypothetical protein
LLNEAHLSYQFLRKWFDKAYCLILAGGFLEHKEKLMGIPRRFAPIAYAEASAAEAG